MGQTSWLQTISILVIGLGFGFKHALDADHLAAVSTIVSQRRSLLGSSLIGALWGVGHTVSLLIAGVAMIALHVTISERLALALEFAVAVMLVGLGANALRKIARGGRVGFHVHRHGNYVHAHPHIDDAETGGSHDTHHGTALRVRPVVVGMVHGLAGSAALMLLVLATIPSPLVAFAYIVVFGIGSIGGMMVMSAILGLPARLTAERFQRAEVAVQALAGLFSLGLGLLMAYQIGVVEGLFL